MVKQELPDEAARKGTLAELLVKPVGPILVPSEDEDEDSRKKSWHATITSGEPQLGGEDGFAPQSYETDHHWNVDTRPAWQRHSELGPNLDAEAKRKAPPEAMQETVNPTDFDWHAAGSDVDVNALRSTYEQMLATDVMHTDADKKAEHLNDDLQLLFVSLILEHTEEIFRCWELKKQPVPLLSLIHI